MNTVKNIPTINAIDVDGQPHALAVGETMNEIGRGTRAKVDAVLVSVDGQDPKPMARKILGSPERARQAQKGYERLKLNLPREEQEKLVREFYVGTNGNDVYMTLLNEDKRVISMGKNESQDRAELQQNKLKAIPNFSAIVQQLLDAMEKAGDKCLPIGPDVYFFTIDRKTNEMDYVYADTETAAARSELRDDEVVLMNLYWAGGALNHFLHECVEQPDMYLDLVRREVLSRIRAHGSLYADAGPYVQMLQRDFQWPTLHWRQWLPLLPARVWMGIVRHMKSVWGT